MIVTGAIGSVYGPVYGPVYGSGSGSGHGYGYNYSYGDGYGYGSGYGSVQPALRHISKLKLFAIFVEYFIWFSHLVRPPSKSLVVAQG